MEILDPPRRPEDDVEAEAAAILGIDPPATARPAQARPALPAATPVAADVEAEAAAILGIGTPGRSQTVPAAAHAAAPAAPMAVSGVGPRVPAVAPLDAVRALGAEYGVHDARVGEPQALPAEYRRRAADLLRGDTTPEGRAYLDHLEGRLDAAGYWRTLEHPNGVLDTGELVASLATRGDVLAGTRAPVVADATRPGGADPSGAAEAAQTRLGAYRARTGDTRTDAEVAASLPNAAPGTNPVEAALSRDAALRDLDEQARAEDEQDTSPEALRRRLVRYYDETGFVERLGNRIGMGVDGIETTREVQRLVSAYDRLDRLKAMRDAPTSGGGMTRAQLQDGGAFEQMDLARDPERLAAEIAELERWIPERTAALAEVQARGQARPRNPAATATANADTFGGAARAFASDPLGVVGEIAIPSAVQMAPALAVSAATGGVGGLPAVAASIGVGSGLDEYSSYVVGRLAQDGVNVTDAAALERALSDRTAMAGIQADAQTRGLVVGSVDALSGALSAAHLLPAPARRALAGRVTDAVAALGVQAGLGGAGEALGSLSVGEDVSPGAVLSEAIGELGSGGGEILAARHADATTAPEAGRGNPLGQRARTYETGTATAGRQAPAPSGAPAAAPAAAAAGAFRPTLDADADGTVRAFVEGEPEGVPVRIDVSEGVAQAVAEDGRAWPLSHFEAPAESEAADVVPVAAAGALPPEAAAIAEALPFAETEAERLILQAELDRLRNAAPAPASDAPAVGPAAARPDRAVGADATAVAASVPTGGRAGGNPVDAGRVDGRPVASPVAPVAAQGQAVGPKRRIARGQNEAVYVRFQDDLHAALYDYGSSIGSRSGNNPTRGQQKAGERRAALIARGIPEAQVEALAREEYNAVRSAARVGEGGETLTPARLYGAAPVAETSGRTAPPRAAGQSVQAYTEAHSAALLADAQAELTEAVDPADYDDPGAVQEAQLEAAARSDNPVLLAEAWRTARDRETLALDPSGSAEGAIAEHIGFISTADLAEVGPDLPVQARKAYFRRSTFQGATAVRSLVEVAEAISEESGVAVTADDVVAFVRAYPSGTAQYRADVRRPRRQVEARWREVTGEPVTEKRVMRVLDTVAGPQQARTVTLPEPVAPAEGRPWRVTDEDLAGALADLGRFDLFSNPLPDANTLRAWGTVAGYYVERGAVRFADFSDRMVETVGEAVRDHLDRLFAEAGGTREAGDTETPAAPPVGETVQDVLARIAARRAAPPATVPPTPAAPPTLALTKAENARVREALGLDALAPPLRQTWTETLERVVASGLVAQMDTRAASIVSPPEGKTAVPLSADEHAALLVRLAQVQGRYRETIDAAREADERGEPADELRARALVLLETADMLTRASDLAGTEIGRSMAVRRMALQTAGESFTVAAAVRDAATLKGAPLTDAQRDRIADLAQAAVAAGERVKASETRRRDRTTDRALDAADATVKRETETVQRTERAALDSDEARARREAAIVALRDERARIKAEIGALGFRVNDVTGLTVDGARLVSRLALNYAKEGAYTLAEIVERVRIDLPDLTGEDVVRAIAGVTTADRAEDADTDDDAEHLALLVAQARARRAVRAAQQALVTPTVRERLWMLPDLSRAVMATGDMSSVGNQGAPLAARHPVRATRAFASAWTGFFDEETAERIDAAMRADTHQPLRELAGLYLAPLGDDAAAVQPEQREELFRARSLGPWFVRSGFGAAVGAVTLGPLLTPVGGAVVGAAVGMAARTAMKASERHMVLFLNVLRSSVFDAWLDAHPDASRDDMKAYARHVNLLTGRGEMSADMARAGAVVLFSPRNTAARFQAPYQIVKPGVSKAVRVEAARSFAAFIGSRMLLLSALQTIRAMLQGEDDDPLLVGADPRDSDFGKIVWGPMRIDVWGGYSAQARLFLRVVLAGTDAYGFTERPAHRRDIDPLEEFGRMAANKKAPWIGTLLALWTGEGFDGKPVTATETLAQGFTPIGAQTTIEAFGTDGTTQARLIRAGGAFALNFGGIAADAYDDPTQASGVKPFFERAQYRALPAPPDDMPEEEREAYTEDFRRRLAASVRGEARTLSGIAEPSELKERIEALTRTARLEARGKASGDPLGTPEMIARFTAADYMPSPGAPAVLGDSAKSVFENDFRRRLASAVSADAETLDMLGPEQAKERLQDHARLVRETTRAEATGDPLAPVLETLQRADYRALPYAPQDMPEDERDAYRIDFNRRMARLVQDEEAALAEMAPEDAKERLRSLAAGARADARTAAGY